jgi:hypothetical protein
MPSRCSRMDWSISTRIAALREMVSPRQRSSHASWAGASRSGIGRARGHGLRQGLDKCIPLVYGVGPPLPSLSMTKRAAARTRRWVPCEVEAAGMRLSSVYGPIAVSRWHQLAWRIGRLQGVWVVGWFSWMLLIRLRKWGGGGMVCHSGNKTGCNRSRS